MIIIIINLLNIMGIIIFSIIINIVIIVNNTINIINNIIIWYYLLHKRSKTQYIELNKENAMLSAGTWDWFKFTLLQGSSKSSRSTEKAFLVQRFDKDYSHSIYYKQILWVRMPFLVHPVILSIYNWQLTQLISLHNWGKIFET